MKTFKQARDEKAAERTEQWPSQLLPGSFIDGANWAFRWLSEQALEPLEGWQQRVEEATRIFRSPFSDNIRLSQIQDERWNYYVSGQALASEVGRLKALLASKDAGEP